MEKKVSHRFVLTWKVDSPLPASMHRPSAFLTGSSFSMSNLIKV